MRRMHSGLKAETSSIQDIADDLDELLNSITSSSAHTPPAPSPSPPAAAPVASSTDAQAAVTPSAVPMAAPATAPTSDAAEDAPPALSPSPPAAAPVASPTDAPAAVTPSAVPMAAPATAPISNAAEEPVAAPARSTDDAFFELFARSTPADEQAAGAEKRLAQDGAAYSQMEFLEFYGEAAGAEMWTQAAAPTAAVETVPTAVPTVPTAAPAASPAVPVASPAVPVASPAVPVASPAVPVASPALANIPALETQAGVEKRINEADVLSTGVRPAPEYGGDMYVASLAQLDAVAEIKMQHVQASMKALKRYVEELENDLTNTEEDLFTAERRFEEEKALREAAERERDELWRQKESLEAKLVEDTQEQFDAEKEVEELDRQAELIAEQLANGELTEEEAAEAEEDLMRAQARKIHAMEQREAGAQQIVEVVEMADDASRRASAASDAEERLGTQLQRTQDELQRTQQELTKEAKLREEADDRFNRIAERLRAKAEQEDA